MLSLNTEGSRGMRSLLRRVHVACAPKYRGFTWHRSKMQKRTVALLALLLVEVADDTSEHRLDLRAREVEHDRGRRS